MKQVIARGLLAGAMLAATAGCNSFRGTQPVPQRPAFSDNPALRAISAIEAAAETGARTRQHNAAPVRRAEPNIKTGHVLLVRVMSRNRIEIEEKSLRVSGRGEVTLPMLGDVRLTGFTREEAKAMLSARYSEYIRKPAVTVDFVAAANGREPGSPWGYVTVLGCVKQPGNVNIPATGNLTVTAAIQECGGLGVGARHNRVQVVQRDEAGKSHTRRVDLHKIERNGRPAGEIPLRNGDVVFVPEGLF